MIPIQDKLADMVTATAEVDLQLSDFRPVSSPSTPVHVVKAPRFPVIDYHDHLDSVSPTAALQVMDAAGVERIVNITMQVGDAAFAIANSFRHASKDRFLTIGWMNWSGPERPDFVQVTIDDRVFACTTFDAYRFNDRDFAEHAIIGLNQAFAQGGIAAKVWKNIGLEVKDPKGNYILPDNPALTPIYRDIAAKRKTLIMHIADPDTA